MSILCQNGAHSKPFKTRIELVFSETLQLPKRPSYNYLICCEKLLARLRALLATRKHGEAFDASDSSES